MNRDEQILNLMAKLFRAFPASGRVDAETIRDYCEAVQAFPASLIERAVDDFRLGKIDRTRSFAPSIPEILSVLRRTPMSNSERAEYLEIRTAIENRPSRLALVKP